MTSAQGEKIISEDGEDLEATPIKPGDIAWKAREPPCTIGDWCFRWANSPIILGQPGPFKLCRLKLYLHR
jgi:hypothetical protein